MSSDCQSTPDNSTQDPTYKPPVLNMDSSDGGANFSFDSSPGVLSFPVSAAEDGIGQCRVTLAKMTGSI